MAVCQMMLSFKWTAAEHLFLMGHSLVTISDNKGRKICECEEFCLDSEQREQERRKLM